MTIDTSAAAVERIANWHEHEAHGWFSDGAIHELGARHRDTAALLRALVAELEATKEADLTYMQRLLADIAMKGAATELTAYARGFREGAEQMREACAREAAEHGGYASNDMDADHLIDRMQARGRMDMADEIRDAIRALPLPEPQA